MEDKYEALKLKNQLCFPIYLCAKEIQRRYAPILDKLNLTYTQYIAMMVLWERGQCSVKELGEKLCLDSGTLTPVVKSLEQKGFVRRFRSSEDERVLLVELTDSGRSLSDSARDIPKRVGACLNLTPEEGAVLHGLLYKILGR